jgi:CRISPR-associated protein Csm4
MSVWKLVKLNFGRSPAHFGEVGIGMEETSDRVRSDALFSAWVSIYARLFGNKAVEELLQQFPCDKQQQLTPPFRISSTFIYRELSNETIYYLPRPLKFPIEYPDDDLAFFKAYKKLNYIPLQVWQRWYQGEGFKQSDIDELIEYTRAGKSHGDLNKFRTFDYNKAFKIDKVPKIAVDRVTRATNLYHTGFVQFEWENNLAGLYFLLQLSPKGEKLANNLQAALHLLGEEGIGGERSSGAGRFQVEWLELSEDWQKVVDFSAGNHHTVMSLFWDTPITTDFLDNASYDIQERGGWIAENHQVVQEYLQTILGQKNVCLQSIPGINYDLDESGSALEQMAILLRKLITEAKGNVTLAATGGFKAQTMVMALVGNAFKIPVCYVHEQYKALIYLPYLSDTAQPQVLVKLANLPESGLDRSKIIKVQDEFYGHHRPKVWKKVEKMLQNINWVEYVRFDQNAFSAPKNGVKAATRKTPDGRHIFWIHLHESEQKHIAVSVETTGYTPEHLEQATKELRERLGSLV